ncbi:2'-5' RNA ligase family protein [Haloferax namakaokahaiae]|uniref:2'-5' RNA ligase family protein n=1 Tax=Haloferax namakaokahaiae TaxID=1748331 RepID=A0ABD5ZJ43_9EURY
MYSLNVPVPGQVSRLASDLFPYLTAFDRIRDRHTLVCKRFEDSNRKRLQESLRHALRGSPAFEVQVTGIDYFESPPVGSAPVVYLAIESPGLFDLHDRLTDEFGTVEGLEGENYTPHVTLARSGSLADAQALAERDIDPITWTVSRLELYDPEFRESVATVSLPA